MHRSVPTQTPATATLTTTGAPPHRLHVTAPAATSGLDFVGHSRLDKACGWCDRLTIAAGMQLQTVAGTRPVLHACTAPRRWSLKDAFVRDHP